MKNIEEKIINCSKSISKNIEFLKDESGLLSQNILSELRNLVEHIFLFIYSDYEDIEDIEIEYISIQNSKKFIKKMQNIVFYMNFLTYCKYRSRTI